MKVILVRSAPLMYFKRQQKRLLIMRILLISTNPDFQIKDTGTTATRRKLIELLLLSNRLFFLDAKPHCEDGISARYSSEEINRTYHFKQLFLGKRCLTMFTDLNPFFFLKVRKIVDKEKVNLIIVTEPYGIVVLSSICGGIPVVYDSHDVAGDHAKIGWKRLQMDFRITMVPLLNSFIRSIFLGYIMSLEKLACRMAKHIIAITDLDKQRFNQGYGVRPDKITVIPPWIEVEEHSDGSRGTRKDDEIINVIFHGTYRHPANYEAFMLIINYIAPKIYDRDRNIQFILAGTDLPKFEKENIKALGHVDDLNELLKSCQIAIVPIRGGTGIRTKILDYMSAGLPVITTRKGIEGIKVEDAKHAIIVDTVDERFIDAILDLASDDEKRRTLGMSTLELVRAKYNRESIKAKVDTMLSELKDSLRKCAR